MHIKAARFAKDDSPLDPGCDCPVCRRHTQAYLRHLYNVGEPSAGRLVSLHNLAWLTGLVARARAAVLDGSSPGCAKEVIECLASAPVPPSVAQSRQKSARG